MNISDITHVGSELLAARIFNRTYKPPPGVNLTLSHAEVNASLDAYAPTGQQSLGNGWVHNMPQVTNNWLPAPADGSNFSITREFIAHLCVLKRVC